MKSDEHFYPPIEEQRQFLQGTIAQQKRDLYGLVLELQLLDAQNPGARDDTKIRVPLGDGRIAETTYRDRYSGLTKRKNEVKMSIQRLQDLLDDLPQVEETDEEEKPKGPKALKAEA